MQAIQKIPYKGARVESGAVKFGEDWPGLFLRGDNCIDIAGRIAVAIEYLDTYTPAEEKTQIHYAIALAGLEGVQAMILDDVLQPPGGPYQTPGYPESHDSKGT